MKTLKRKWDVLLPPTPPPNSPSPRKKKRPSGKPLSILYNPEGPAEPANEQSKGDVTDATRYHLGLSDASEPDWQFRIACKSAKDWNVALAWGRRARGPQWDFGTAMFMVPQCSEAYYGGVPSMGPPPEQPKPSHYQGGDSVEASSPPAVASTPIGNRRSSRRIGNQ